MLFETVGPDGELESSGDAVGNEVDDGSRLGLELVCEHDDGTNTGRNEGNVQFLKSSVILSSSASPEFDQSRCKSPSHLKRKGTLRRKTVIWLKN